MSGFKAILSPSRKNCFFRMIQNQSSFLIAKNLRNLWNIFQKTRTAGMALMYGCSQRLSSGCGNTTLFYKLLLYSLMQAVICAAGRGSRVARLTEKYPKALLPVGDKRVIEHILEALVASGITKVIVVVGYRKEAVMSYLGNEH